MPRTRTTYQKGGPPGPGRPKGCKNKSYLDASLWLSLAFALVQDEKDPEKQLPVIKWATELIMQKVPVLPATPGDSVSNAVVAQTLLTALENGNATSPVNPGTAPVNH